MSRNYHEMILKEISNEQVTKLNKDLEVILPRNCHEILKETSNGQVSKLN